MFVSHILVPPVSHHAPYSSLELSLQDPAGLLAEIHHTLLLMHHHTLPLIPPYPAPNTPPYPAPYTPPYPAPYTPPYPASSTLPYPAPYASPYPTPYTPPYLAPYMNHYECISHLPCPLSQVNCCVLIQTSSSSHIHQVTEVIYLMTLVYVLCFDVCIEQCCVVNLYIHSKKSAQITF